MILQLLDTEHASMSPLFFVGRFGISDVTDIKSRDSTGLVNVTSSHLLRFGLITSLVSVSPVSV